MSSLSINESIDKTVSTPVSTTSGLKSFNFKEYVPTAPVALKMDWHACAIAKLNDFDQKLEEYIPNFTVQKKLDDLGAFIEKQFMLLAPFNLETAVGPEPTAVSRFNGWLQSNGQGAWYDQLLQCICKLPFRAARNVVQQLYFIIRGVMYGVIHPLKALNMVAKLLVSLPHELIKPETWSKMGTGTVGTYLGQATIATNFLSVVGIGIGAAMIVAGVTTGTLKAAIDAEKGDRLNASSKYLQEQAAVLSETFVTSFYIGLIIGGIRKAIDARQQKQDHTKQEVEQKVQQEKVQTTKSPDFYDVIKLCRNNPDNYPPVAYAVKLGRHDVVKYLIDQSESVHAATQSYEIWADTGDWNVHWKKIATQPGYTPLELAIKNNDLEMVKILTSYDPVNRATTAFSVTRYPDAQFVKGDGGFGGRWYNYDHYEGNWAFPGKIEVITSSPLSDALALGNKEIIECVIKSYTTPESLLQAFQPIQATGQLDLMRHWTEQLTFLQKGAHLPACLGIKDTQKLDFCI